MRRLHRWIALGMLVSLVISTQPLRAQTETALTEAVMSVSGDVETVFDWTTDRCNSADIPDLPARAFRDDKGQVQLIATHYVATRNIGPTLNDVRHDCAVVSQSVSSPDPSLFADKEWLASLYTEDGSTIYALKHNEYQGHMYPGQCASGQYFDCWYNAITLAVSQDGGETYHNVMPPPEHLVAALPYSYEDGAGPYGIFEPSNIIRGPDGYLYATVKVDAYRSSAQWVCLMRTDNLADPRSWRAWDGDGFDLAFPNPYTESVADPDQQQCAPIALDAIGAMRESITYNTYLEQYVFVGTMVDTIDGRQVWGVFYSFSNDLIHWSRRQLLLETELLWTYRPGDADPISYPSLLDPDSDSRNFETTDQNAYLYYTQFHYVNGQQTLDRDLVRIPVRFDRIEAFDAPEYAFTRSGVVPSDATGALVGYRINTECNCSGVADFSLYSVRFVEGSSTRNLVPNSRFASGLSGWHAWGSASKTLEPNDLTRGQALRIVAASGEIAALNGPVFPVSAGAAYTVTFTAQVRNTTTNAGYFALIFVDDKGEIRRETLPLVPNAAALPMSGAIAHRFGLPFLPNQPFSLPSAYALSERHYRLHG